MATQSSVVLITVDCLRADHVGSARGSNSITPVLDSLAKESVVFDDAIVAGAPTYFSFPAIHASRYPLGLGRDVVGIAPGEPTLATALHDAGYRTAAFVAGNPYLTARFGYDEGFETFQDFLSGESPNAGATPVPPEVKQGSAWNRRIHAASRFTKFSAAIYDELYFRYCQWRSSAEDLSFDQLRRYPAADVVVDEACAWLNSVEGQRFFLWVHLMDPHHPYYPPAEALAAVGAERISAQRARFLNSFWNRGDLSPRGLSRHKEEVLSLYDGGVYWADKQIGRLVEVLQKTQKWKRTVFAVTADHGEEFLEHGARYHSPANLPEQLIRVPLLLHAEGLTPARISARPFSHIHLPATLLEAVEAPVPESFQGRSFWKEICAGCFEGEPAIAECVEACNNPLRVSERMRARMMAVRDRNGKLVVHFSRGTADLYDLCRDPDERSPVPLGNMKEERARLLRVAQAHLQNTRRKRNTNLALRARLRELKQTGLKREAVPEAALPG